MKKLLYMTALLAVAAGCAKTESAPEMSDVVNLSVRVNVSNGADTKAKFDGDSHIKFEKGDAFYAAIAKESTPTTGIKVASRATAAASQYYSVFTIENFEAESPVFKGNFYSIIPANIADTYKFYGAFPSSAVASTAEDLTKWRVNLSGTQSASQTEWDSKSDVMIVKPTDVSSESRTENGYNEYDFSSSNGVEFAHIFGFGKLSFSDMPEKYASLKVKSVTIEAVGEKKDICGQFFLDITGDAAKTELKALSPGASIVVTPKDEVTVKDNVVWFVANPGTYDVKITVATPAYDLVFERQGLVVSRSKITSPTVHFKEADTAVSHDVILAEGESWGNTFSYYNCLSSSKRSQKWGNDPSKQMAFSLAYPGSGNDNYGSSASSDAGYVQLLAYQAIQGKKVILSSDAAFGGIKLVKANLGIYTNDATGTFTLSLEDGDKSYKLGSVKITGTNDNCNGVNYYFANTTGVEYGRFVLTVDSLSTENCRPYIGVLSFNSAPEVVFAESVVKVDKIAGSFEVACDVKGANADPEVTVSEDAKGWLTASYADGKLTYTVKANEGAKRAGTVTVKAKGIGGDASAEFKVVQASATSAEYKLSVSASEVYPSIQAKIKELEDGGQTVEDDAFAEMTIPFTAKGTADPSKTTTVNLKFAKVLLKKSTEEYVFIKSTIAPIEAIGPVSNVTVVSSNPVDNGYFAMMEVKFSTNGTNWTKAPKSTITSEKGSDGYYTSVVVNDNSDYQWFSIAPDGYSANYVKSFEVIFVEE